LSGMRERERGWKRDQSRSEVRNGGTKERERGRERSARARARARKK